METAKDNDSNFSTCGSEQARQPGMLHSTDKSAGIVGLKPTNTKRDNIMRSINTGVRQQLGRVPSTPVH